MLRDEQITTPIVAAVNGYCVAGGMEFLQATDIRIAAESATFGLQEPRWGICPMGGSHVRLPRQIPYCRAMEFLLTGDLFSARRAADAGLINEVVPDGEALSRAEEFAASIAENSPFAVQKIKETVLETRQMVEADAFRVETEHAREVFEHEDAREGLSAFAEDRDPSFRR
jgi:enoyl-CoA hydratase